MATKHGHTRRYDLFARVPQEVNIPRQRRDLGDLHSYRVVGVDSDSTGRELPDEVEYTIDTPQITELDSLGSEITLGEGGSGERSRDGVSGRWEQVSIPGTLQNSQGTFSSDVDGPKPPEQRWETASLTATVAGSRGTLNIEDAERLYGRVDKSNRRDSKQGRWERMSTRGTLKGSSGTIREDSGKVNGKQNTPYRNKSGSYGRERTNLSRVGSRSGKSRNGSRWSHVSLQGTEKGSQGSFNIGPERRLPYVPTTHTKIRKGGSKNAILRDGHIQE
jgi:hypothetical protein